MRKLLIFLFIIVALVVGVWIALLVYLDEPRLKQIATEQVREQTGRELLIEGPLKLKVFPSISVVAEEVNLSGPDDYQGPPLFTADRFSMSLKLMPLISGTVETGAIGLEGAVVNIHTDADGRSSLDGLAGGSDAAPETAPSGEAPSVTTGEIVLSDIELVVSDAGAGSRQVFIVERFGIESFAFDRPILMEFRGQLGEPAVVGDIDLQAMIRVPSGDGPITVTDMTFDSAVSGMRLGLSGNAELQSGPPMVVRFSDGVIRLDDQEFQTGFSFVDSPRPRVEARLVGGMLDVDGLLAAIPTPEEAESDPDAESPVLLLRDLDVDAELVLDAMRISGLELESIEAALLARNGVVTIDPLTGALAGGRMDAVARIDLNVEPPSVRLSPVFDLESLGQALQPWGLDRFLSGQGRLELDLDARGLDPNSILSTLNGTGQYAFEDGQIKGLNLDGMVEALSARNIAQAVQAGVGGTTAFETFAGPLSIEDGTIRMPGLELITRLLGVTGDVRLGLADLGLAGELQLQGEGLKSVPVKLDGSLLKPQLMPDVGEALKEEAGRRVLDFLKDRGNKDEQDDGDGGR